MTVTWILERDVFSEECFNQMIAHFKANDIPYHVVRIIPFIHEIEGKIPQVSGPVVVYGSIGTQKLAAKQGWAPGVWTGHEFSERALVKRLGKQALNNDMVILTFREAQERIESLPEIFFVKPNTDTKDFAGTVTERKEFDNWANQMIESGYVDEFTVMDLEICISAPANLGCEWRFVMVDGKVSSCSYYRQYQRVMPELGAPKEVIEYAEWIAWQFGNPTGVYVMDIAEVTDNAAYPMHKYRVIEYNTFNSAGLYKADVSKIINDINSYVEATYAH